MDETCGHHLLPVMLIPTDTCASHSVTVSNKDEHCKNLRQSSKCGDDECVL